MQGLLLSFQQSGGRELWGVLFEVLLWRGIKVRIQKPGAK